jgi:hypothetical protein
MVMLRMRVWGFGCGGCALRARQRDENQRQGCNQEGL